MKKYFFLLFMFLLLVPVICCAEESIYTAEDNNSIINSFAAGETMKNNNGTITTNSGTIDYNFWTIENNEGVVKNNFSIIKNNTGTVINNYSYNLISNTGTVINDYIMSTANRDYLNAQNTFYQVNFPYINENIVDLKWNGPVDPKGDYYYGVSTNVDADKRGASFAFTLINEGYEFKGIDSGSATLTKIGENIYEIAYEEEKTLDIKIKFLPIITEIAETGGEIIRKDYFESDENSYDYINYDIVPDEGYKIVDVLINGKSVGAVEEYSLNDVRTPTTIKAIFKKITPPVPETSDNGIIIWIVLSILSIMTLIGFVSLKKIN